MSELLLNRAGRRRSPATMPGFHRIPAHRFGSVPRTRPCSSRTGESSTNRQPYLRQCPRRSSNSQPTIPIARCGSGMESSGSPSRHGPLRPDRGGRPTPTTYAWESTIVDPVPAIPLPFRTSPSRTCPERSTASANSAARSSTPAISGPYAGTPRAARSRWPPRPQSRNSTGQSLLARSRERVRMHLSMQYVVSPPTPKHSHQRRARHDVGGRSQPEATEHRDVGWVERGPG